MPISLTCETESTVLRSTFVLQVRLCVDKVEAQVLPGTGSSVQLDPGTLRTNLRQTGHSMSTVQCAAKVPGFFNAVVPARTASHWQSWGQRGGGGKHGHKSIQRAQTKHACRQRKNTYLQNNLLQLVSQQRTQSAAVAGVSVPWATRWAAHAALFAS